MPSILRFRFVLVVSAVVVTNIVQAQGRALTIEDYYRVKTAGAPQISPDGRWVAYTVSTRIEVTNADSSEVWLAAADGSSVPRRLNAAGTNGVAPAWDDTGRLTFASAGRRWTVNPARPDSVIEGGGVTQQGGQAVRRIVSPNGYWTASVRNTAVPRHDRQFASEFERRHEERFRGVQFDWLNFQQDGQPFPVPNRADPAVFPPQEIFISPSAENGEPRTDSARQLTRIGLRPAGVQWNRDGTMLLFTADMNYRDERQYASADVYTVSLDGNVRRMTPDSDYHHTDASFSPDGRWILYSRQLSTNAVIAKKLNHGGPDDLVLIPAGGGPEKNLTADWDYLPSSPMWSPDGRHVYFAGGIGGTTHLFRVPVEGGRVEQVTKGERRISGLSVDRAFTKIAYTVGLIETPAEVYVANIDGSGERRISSVNDAFTREVGLSKADRLLFPSKDGTQIEGWLLYPHGYRRENGPYPLIVASHGGPHAADGYSFNFKDQYFAANGYFVLRTNFRSSTGYGEKFLWGTWGAWGDKDGQDVMAGIDYAMSKVPIAKNRVATIGHSYGGFMTNWLITQYPDRFAAAVPGAGIVNWVSDYGTADIARTKETEFFGYPWEERARNIMIRQSPLTYADRVKTPTLFIHGEVDQRVPYSEAEQMFVALKKLGVPTKMIQYAGMAHGINGSWNNVHRMLNELRWIDTYLKGRPTP
jgi:dipeptidyl aminopeptidase/acylaminoacyl peptidase